MSLSAKAAAELYDDEYLEWVNEHYGTPMEELKRMDFEELSEHMRRLFEEEKINIQMNEKKAMQTIAAMTPSRSFEEILGEADEDGYILDDFYWNLFCAVMDLLPEGSLSNRGRTVDEFWKDRQAVEKLYESLYGWVDQDLEGFGLVGNIGVALHPGRDYDTSEFWFESFDFNKAIELFIKNYMSA